MKNQNVRQLTSGAILIALATVLSVIPFIQMPLGGKLTPFSMVPIILFSLMYGAGKGLAVSFVYSLIQLALSIAGVLTWGLTPASLVGTIVLDYILAYSVLGVAGLFRRKGMIGIIGGVILACALRFACHFLSGAIIFDIWCEWNNAWIYSLCYNGLYMLPETVLTVVGAVLLFRVPQIKKLFIAE